MSAHAPIIDLHSHWFSPASVGLLRQRDHGPRITSSADGTPRLHRSGVGQAPAPFALGPQWFDIPARLAHLDATGVVHQLISWPTTLGVDPALEASASLPIWHAWNDELAALVRAHPRRFSGLAALSSSDVAWSARELARAIDTLGLVGGTLPVGGFATLAGARHLAPILEAAQQRRAHLYLHTGLAHSSVPGQPPQALHADANGPRAILDMTWLFASAVITLIHTDVLDAYPDVTVQVAMLGGSGLPALLAEQLRFWQQSDEAAARQRLQRVWLDTGAAGQGPAAVAAAVRELGAERVVFGSDYAPAADIAPVLAHVRQAGASPAQEGQILFDNAHALLRRHGVDLPAPVPATADLPLES